LKSNLHAYTITHAIDDKNVLRFHIDYFKGKGTQNQKPGEAIAQQAVVEAILEKHDAATNSRRFNAVFSNGFY
jgi:type I restriction enzyme R subunit